MQLPVFRKFSKIPRLFRGVVLTEKIDGTNGCIYVPDDNELPLVAGSRNRWLERGDDNFGFAQFVEENEAELRKLGPGYHYGEWFGKGIQRGYGLNEKRFALFNVSRWFDGHFPRPSGFGDAEPCPEIVSVAPVLAVLDTFDTNSILTVMNVLQEHGSIIVPGFMKPEGVVIMHEASGQLYKATLDNDGAKGNE